LHILSFDSLKLATLMLITVYALVAKIGDRWFTRVIIWKSIINVKKVRKTIENWSNNSLRLHEWDSKAQKFE